MQTTKLTFSSLGSGGKWGTSGRSRASYAPAGGLANKQVADAMKTQAAGFLVEADKMPMSIQRAYLDLISAIGALEDAPTGDESELDIGFCPPVWFSGKSTATRVCLLLSFLISAMFVGVAALFSVWGISVHGSATLNLTALEMYQDGVALPYGNLTCEVEAQDSFALDTFLGWPNERVFWNLYGGLVLGLVFGFLDNFGLFYGMGALDPLFYGFGRRVAAGLMRLFGRAQDASLALELHEVTNDLMAGLGNTFSDLLGVALGTAALEIAKAGLNTSPAFWILDLVAIVLGCLIGCFMPVLLKHKEKLGNESTRGFIAGIAWISILGLFAAVLLAGVPYEAAHVASFAILCFNIVLLVLLLVVSSCAAGGVLNTADQKVRDVSIGRSISA